MQHFSNYFVLLLLLIRFQCQWAESSGAKKFQERMRSPTLPPTFRAYQYRTFVVSQYNCRMCWCYNRSSSSKVYQL